MKDNWMGRYRPLVGALVLHVNVASRGQKKNHDIGDGIMLTTQEWQILEYLVEHRNEYTSMIEISRAIGIPQSSFSRMAGVLERNGLVEKYQMHGNMKNIILKPTAYAVKLYSELPGEVNPFFEQFFRELETVSDEDLETMVNALNHLTVSLPSAENGFPDGGEKK